MKDFPIPNWIPCSMVAAFALLAVLVPMPGGVGGHIMLALGMFVFGLVLFATRGFGGGVVKLFVAASLWIGPNDAFLAFAGIVIVGGFLWAVFVRVVWGKVESIPYSPVVLAAFLITMPHAPIWITLMSHGHASV